MRAVSFDVFVGRPATRILWAADLLRYYHAETDWNAHGDQSRDAILPEISRFALELAEEWPPLNATGPFDNGVGNDDEDNPRCVEYSFGPRSIYLCCRWSQAEEAREQICAMAARHKLLFFNCSGFDWMNAVRSHETGRPGEISVFESQTPGSSRQLSGKITWIEPGDAALLTEPDRFRPDCYFTCEVAAQYYMQVLNSGEHYVIEYRDGSPERHYQAKTPSLEKIREALQLYLQNDPRAFQLFDYANIQV